MYIDRERERYSHIDIVNDSSNERAHTFQQEAAGSMGANIFDSYQGKLYGKWFMLCPIVGFCKVADGMSVLREHIYIYIYIYIHTYT